MFSYGWKSGFFYDYGDDEHDDDLSEVKDELDVNLVAEHFICMP